MPKATWGNDLTDADIDGAERNEQFTPYDGPVPPAGVYRFAVKFMKKGESNNGNPKLQTLLELDGSWKKEHAKYEGAPLWDNMPVMKSTVWRIAAFCDAFGISGKEFRNAVVVDEDGKVTKLASAGDPTGLLVYVNTKVRPAGGGYEASLTLNGPGYLQPREEDEAQTPEDSDAGDSDAGDEEPPF